MKKSNNVKVFYSLSNKDIQTVAKEELERELTMDEISQIQNVIASRINWYDAIADTINEKFRPE